MSVEDYHFIKKNTRRTFLYKNTSQNSYKRKQTHTSETRWGSNLLAYNLLMLSLIRSGQRFFCPSTNALSACKKID